MPQSQEQALFNSPTKQSTNLSRSPVKLFHQDVLQDEGNSEPGFFNIKPKKISMTKEYSSNSTPQNSPQKEKASQFQYVGIDDEEFSEEDELDVFQDSSFERDTDSETLPIH